MPRKIACSILLIFVKAASSVALMRLRASLESRSDNWREMISSSVLGANAIVVYPSYFRPDFLSKASIGLPETPIAEHE